MSFIFYYVIEQVCQNCLQTALCADALFACLFLCVCVGGAGRGGGADGRALVMTSGISYSVMRVEGLILVEATLSQFP